LNIKTAITSLFKTLALVLVLAVLFPSAVKFSHAFTHHSHKVCDSDNEHNTHFHESDYACDFYKFKLTNTQFLVVYDYDTIARNKTTKTFSTHYISFKNYQQLTRFVRGPPQVS
jgi:hypothetical protein